MTVIVYRPKGDWQRSYPLATRIARELAEWPALLGLQFGRLVADVQQRYDVSKPTARRAVQFFALLAQ